MCERISASLEAKPEHAFFKSFENSGLENFQKLHKQPDYLLTDFHPGNISQALQRTLGVPPMLQRSRHMLSEESCVSNNEFIKCITYTNETLNYYSVTLSKSTVQSCQ